MKISTTSTKTRPSDEPAAPTANRVKISPDQYFQVTGGTAIPKDSLTDAVGRRMGLAGTINSGVNTNEANIFCMAQSPFSENVTVGTYHRVNLESDDNNLTSALHHVINEKINPIQNTKKSMIAEVVSLPLARGVEHALSILKLFLYINEASSVKDLKTIGLDFKKLKRNSKTTAFHHFIFLKGDLQKDIAHADDLKAQVERLKNQTTDIDNLGFMTEISVNDVPVLLATGQQRKYIVYLSIITGLTGTMVEDFDALRQADPEMLQMDSWPPSPKNYRKLESFDALFGGEALQKFQTAFKDLPQIPKHRYTHVLKNDYLGVNLLGHTNLKLLKGLATLDIANETQALEPLKLSLGRIEELLEASVENNTSHRDFVKIHSSLHEEILFILDQLRPYKAGDFERAAIQGRQQLQRRQRLQATAADDTDKNKIIHRAFTFTSGMACIANLLSALSEIHGAMPHCAVMADTYYETHDLFERLRGPKHYEENAKKNAKKVVTFIDNDFIEDPEKDPYRLVMLNVHRDATGKIVQFGKREVDRMLEKYLDSPFCDRERKVIVLDVTLDKIDSKEIQHIVNRLTDKIQSGAIDLVLLRSGVKFDHFGSDKINGGQIEVLSSDETLSTALASHPQLTGRDYQWFTHVQLHARDCLHVYNKLHYKNARIFRAQFKQKPEDLIQLSQSLDLKRPFVELLLPGDKDDFDKSAARALLGVLPKLSYNRGITVHRRQGFGFAETCIGIPFANCVRVCLGIEPQSDVKILTEIIRDLNDELTSHSKDKDFSCYNYLDKKREELLKKPNN